jgi:hypothetical protein
VEQCGNGAAVRPFRASQGAESTGIASRSVPPGAASPCSWKGRTRSRSTWGCPSSSRARSRSGPRRRRRRTCCGPRITP